MSSIQQFLVIGGLFLLSLLALNFYRASSIQYDMRYGNEAVVTATSIAQSLIEEMNSKAFDEKAITGKIDTVIALTPTISLGKDSGEVARKSFDDIDDYNAYYLADTTSSLGTFTISVMVRYVSSTDLTTISSNPTFTKKATLFVRNSYLQDELEFDYAFTY